MTIKINTDELNSLQKTVEDAFQNSDLLKDTKTQETVNKILHYIEKGALRVASPDHQNANCGSVPMQNDLKNWIVHSWVKQAILLAMRMKPAQSHSYSDSIRYFDKFDVQTMDEKNGARSVYGSIVREGCFISSGVILMPSFVNIGAWIGENSMIDTWATAGSCAQVGKNVHVAGGVGIGGVLEPANARPVLIGDNAFLGSRAVIVEGTIVEHGAILGANVCLTASTPIYDVTNSEKKEYRGYVPANAVVVPGTRIKTFPGGEIPLQCAYIIAYRNETVDSKVSLNQILRETGIVV
jgi:2,3,4,5-tetrahydropyridine-2-carboxylate N-succinyltransferase